MNNKVNHGTDDVKKVDGALTYMQLQGLSLNSWYHLANCCLPDSFHPSLMGLTVPALQAMYGACLHHFSPEIILLSEYPQTKEILLEIPVVHLCL